MKKILSLENLIYLTIISLPLYLLRFAVFGIPTNVLEVLMGLVIVICLVKYRSDVETHCNASLRQDAIHHQKYIFPIFLIFLGLLISTLFNKNYLAGLGIIKSWFILPLLFSFFAVRILAQKRENIFFAFYISAFFVSLISLIYLFLGHLTYDGRLEAFFNSPIYLAMYLAPAVIFGFLKINFKKLLQFISFVIILFAFYFTYSYAAWVSVLISLSMVFILEKKINKKYLFASFLIILTLAFLLKDTSKFQDLIRLNERSSLASRIMIWKSAEKMLGDNWLWGIGPGNFQRDYLENQKYFPAYLEWAVPHPHSLYLAFWLHGGLAGFLGFLMLIFFWFQHTAETRHCLDSTTYLAAIGIMLYFLLHGLVDTTYFKNDLSVIFWLTFFII